MYTIVETPTFASDAKKLWSEEERGAFCAWLAANPETGDVTPGVGVVAKSVGNEQVQVKEEVFESFISSNWKLVSCGYWSSTPKVCVATSLPTC